MYLVAGGVVVIIVAVVVATVVWLRRRRRQEFMEPSWEIDPRDLPPLVFAADDGASAAMRRAQPQWPAGNRGAITPAAGTEEPDRITPSSEPASAVPPDEELDADSPPEPSADTTLQLLPGRLEVINGLEHEELRFVKIADGVRFTFGRGPGPAHLHVRLQAPTVSRLHAFMEYEGGRWRLGNLSETNPVVVNSSPLNGESEHVLADGDRIEMGEAAFIFRVR